MSYHDKLSNATLAAITELKRREIKDGYLPVGGEGPKPDKAPRAPTDARSEFLANRAMGDWAENLLASSLKESILEWNIVHFGETSSIAAGEEGFAQHYARGLEEVRAYGKRPDLLILPKVDGVLNPHDVVGMPFEEVDALPDRAIGSIEVRSSKFEALTYMNVRQSEAKKYTRDCPSFTVKVEDLVIVYRWLNRKRIPQAYFQVFFDSVFAINFVDIFSHIGKNSKGIAFESPEKSQGKATIMIPITYGTKVANMVTMPTYGVESRVTRLGRHDAFVKPEGGKLEVDVAAVKKVLEL